MQKILMSLIMLLLTMSFYAQRKSINDGNWQQQLEVIRNTKEADLMIRVGDIDNLGFGWEEDFDPFTGRSTPSHAYPWTSLPADTKGTDRIMIPTSFVAENGKNQDGYCSGTSRPDNLPQSISMPLQALRDIKVDSADLQIFIDDFQAPALESKFQVRINGLRFTEAEKIINQINQTGPIGKLVRFRLTPELLHLLNSDSLVIRIDDPVTGQGDGFAIDFVKLLINPKVIYKGTVRGRVIDASTREPIPGAFAKVPDFGTVITDSDGQFELRDIPAGLNIVLGSATGYAGDQKQADIIAGEESEPVELELHRSGKISFNDKVLQEGDQVVLGNIQFDVNSARLLPAGKTELDKLVRLMRENPGMEILLTGHTSSEGSAGLNRELSLNRVRSCKDYLAANGIDDGRISIKGYGPDKPIAPNDTEINRAKNRRVELQITRLTVQKM